MALGMGNLMLIVLDVGLDFTAKNTLRVFDLSEEQSLGTWWTTFLLLFAAIAAAALAAAYPKGTSSRRGWTIFAIFIALLSLDETVAMHERFGPIVFHGLGLPQIFVLAWVIPAVLIVVAFVYWQRGFFASLPGTLRRRLVLAAAVYVGGAAGLEVVESIIVGSSDMNMDATTTVVFSVIEVIEEVLEMLAITWVVLALLDHLRVEAPVWTVAVEESRVRSRPVQDAPTGRFNRSTRGAGRGEGSDQLGHGDDGAEQHRGDDHHLHPYPEGRHDS